MLVSFVYQPMPTFSHLPHRPSLIEHTAQLLRDAISQGTWVDQLPGERELSLQFHVSRPTLRAALALLERDGWLKSHIGRQRSIVAQSPVTAPVCPKIIGMLAPLPLHEIVPFAHIWTDMLREFLAEEGYELQIHCGRRWYAQSPERELAALTHQMPAAAWVLFVASERMQRWFAQSPLVCVTSGSLHSGIRLPSVDLDHRATCRHAAGQFLARGHERVVFLRQGPGSAGDIESEHGFLEAFQGKPGTQPMVAEHDGTLAGIHKQLDTLLRRSPRPTGFLVARAMPTLAIASELIRRGVRLPQDVALIGRDSDHYLDYFSPCIARYKVEPQLHARRLARLVLQYVRGGSQRSQQVRLMPQFIPGESLG